MCAVVLLILGTLTSIEHLCGVNLHIDELVCKQNAEHIAPNLVGKMSPYTAAMQINFAISLLLLTIADKKEVATTIAQCCAFLGGVMGILAFIGYVLEAKELYAVGQSAAIAAPTAFCFITTSIGILCARPQISLMRTFTSQTETGKMLRRFVPLALIAPILVGWIRLKGERMGFYDRRTGLAIMATSSVAICELGIFWLTRKFQEIETILSQRERLLSEQAELLNLTHDAIMMTSLDGEIQFWNKGAQIMYGYSQLDAIGKKSHELLRTKSTTTLEDMKAIALETGKWEGELTHLKKNDQAITVASRWSLKRDGTGKAIGILDIHNDISATKDAEQRVSEFYSVVSHELRTPLTSLKGVFSILTGGRAGDLSERAKSLVIMGSGETERLIRLINNILDMKKIEAGKLELFLETLEPKKIIEGTVAAVASFAAQYKVELAVEIHQNDLIKGDRDRLTQVLTNLISNAVKFSDEGQTVTVLVARKDDFMRFSVIDRGPGISPRNLPKLFRMFQQVKSENHARGGTGLGLAICKSMVEQHGGKIGIDTEEGKGSTFWFEIPCAITPTNEPEKIASLKMP